MSVRWECPNEQHPGVLGPERPRRENVVRYCLPCSEATGKLVERVAPALERRRAARSEQAVTTRKARAEKAAQKERERLTVNGIHLPTEAKMAIRRSATLRQLRTPSIYPELQIEVRRYRTQPGTYGRAWWNQNRIQVNDVPGLDEFDTKETLIHELVHLVTTDGHGPKFTAAMSDAFKEVYGVRGQGARKDRYHGRYAAALREQAA